MWLGRQRSQPDGRTTWASRHLGRIDRREGEFGMAGQERLHLRLALLRLQRAGGVAEPPARPHQRGGTVQQRRCSAASL